MYLHGQKCGDSRGFQFLRFIQLPFFFLPVVKGQHKKEEFIHVSTVTADYDMVSFYTSDLAWS